MAFVAVGKDSDKSEYIFESLPIRLKHWWRYNGDCIQLPSGTIKKLIGRDLSFDDDPVELT